jgi:hypothetical protein
MGACSVNKVDIEEISRQCIISALNFCMLKPSPSEFKADGQPVVSLSVNAFALSSSTSLSCFYSVTTLPRLRTSLFSSFDSRLGRRSMAAWG